MLTFLHRLLLENPAVSLLARLYDLLKIFVYETEEMVAAKWAGQKTDMTSVVNTLCKVKNKCRDASIKIL